MLVAGVVLAAGASTRLGEPKQLLAYRESTILGTTLDTARKCGFAQLIVTLGRAAEQIRASVDLSGCQVVENLEYATGCASSLGAAIGVIDPGVNGLVLMLGDQPEVTETAVRSLVQGTKHARLGICRYDDARGHPFWFSRELFDELSNLHGDKAVWKALESGHFDVVEVRQPGAVPLDVDTWDDYASILAQAESTR
jgi:molybdenum cofactor cytidylyltransferase